jgi:anti-anti-sigma factor
MKESTITITIRTEPSVPNLKIITLKGTFDAVTSMQVDKKMLPMIEQEKSNVILDLSNVDYLSSVGIMCLAQYMVFLNTRNRALRFVKPPDHVFETLRIIGFGTKFEMYDTLEAVINSFKKK